MRRPTLSDPRVALFAIVLAGLVLRLVDAGARINEDEGYSWLVATSGSASQFLARLAHDENTPPLFYLLLEPLPLHSPFWLRFPSIVAGVAAIPILWAIVRELLDDRAALLAALGLAVAPFSVSYADYSRGFMVAGLGVLAALLGAVRLARGGPRGWWWAWVLGGTWALYSEYYSGLFLLAILCALLALGTPSRRIVLGIGVVPFVLFAPWLPELVRSVHDLGHTKLDLPPAAFSLGGTRDAIVALLFGEHGVAGSAPARWLQALVTIGAVGWGAARLRRAASRDAFWLLAGVLVIVFGLYLIATVIDTDILRERYMTTMIPLGAAVVAGAVGTLRWRAVVPALGALLAAGGVAIVAARAGTEYEPDVPAAVAIVAAHGIHTVHTNSPEVSFYGAQRHLHVVLDRPFGMGTGDATRCAPRCAVIDDARFAGVRPGSAPPGETFAVGPLVIRL